MVEDVEAVVKARGLERFVLVGHSMGGVVAVLYAGARPEKVAGLVLVGTPGKAPPERAEKVLASLETDQREQVIDQYWAKLLEGATDETRKVVEVGREKMGYDRSQSFIRAVFEYDPTSALRKYDGPVLAITSPGDDQPAAIHKALPISRREISGTSHWPMLDEPDEFNRLLDEFLGADGTRIGS
jgi:pimeloyl-ACP methyl ester carboxylesterase